MNAKTDDLRSLAVLSPQVIFCLHLKMTVVIVWVVCDAKETPVSIVQDALFSPPTENQSKLGEEVIIRYPDFIAVGVQGFRRLEKKGHIKQVEKEVDTTSAAAKPVAKYLVGPPGLLALSFTRGLPGSAMGLVISYFPIMKKSL